MRRRQINHSRASSSAMRSRAAASSFSSSATRACSCPIMAWTYSDRMAAAAPPRGGCTHERMTTMTLFDRHTQDRSQGEPMRDPRAECIRQAYLEMAPFYRPEAPNDGFGHIELTAEELRDLDRLDQEARDYALAFVCQDETARFRLLGPLRHPINPVAIWALEAAYLLCAGEESNLTAAKLLRLALKQIERPN